VPVVMKGKKPYLRYLHQRCFPVRSRPDLPGEKRPHPLNALTADEIKQAVEIVKASADFKPNTRFTQIALAEPEKAKVWDFVLNGTAVDAPRQAKIVMLDGKHVIESVVDLKDKKSCAGSRSKTRTAWCCWMISPRAADHQRQHRICRGA
jgi:primary-amine oxidase